MSAEDFDSLQETIAVLSDQELLTAHGEGMSAIASDDHLDADGLQNLMRNAGR